MRGRKGGRKGGAGEEERKRGGLEKERKTVRKLSEKESGGDGESER